MHTRPTPMCNGGEMQTSDDERFAVDTSVAVAALDATHGAHRACLIAVQELRPVLAGHAAFETFSVLTRMPGQLAVDGPTAAEIMRRVFPETVWLTPEHSSELLGGLGPVGIVGRSVYDALVGEAARTSNRVLLTRDRRAVSTYTLLGVKHQLVGP